MSHGSGFDTQNKATQKRKETKIMWVAAKLDGRVTQYLKNNDIKQVSIFPHRDCKRDSEITLYIPPMNHNIYAGDAMGRHSKWKSSMSYCYNTIIKYYIKISRSNNFELLSIHTLQKSSVYDKSLKYCKSFY